MPLIQLFIGRADLYELATSGSVIGRIVGDHEHGQHPETRFVEHILAELIAKFGIKFREWLIEQERARF
jgi:hypothetical protein